jgi:hypothetical protein
VAAIYANENLPLPVVEGLRQRGHDVLTTLESGRANQSIPDDDVLAYAAALDRILVTINRKHFLRLHRQNVQHAGIVICTFDRDYDGLAQRIHDALQAHYSMAQQLVRVNRPG